MKFTRVFTAFSAVLAAVPLSFASPVLADTSLTQVYRRQVVSANVCATIRIAVPIKERQCFATVGGAPATGVITVFPAVGYTCRETGATIDVVLADSICLCLAAGVLTPNSVITLRDVVLANTTNTARLLLPYNGILPLFTAVSLSTTVTANVVAQLGGSSTQCVYGENAYPSSCTSCDFTCPALQKACGRGCIAQTATCISGGLRRREQWSTQERCPGRLSACAIPNSGTFNGLNFECIDTTTDIESCGACAFPLPGQSTGEDCTTIPNISTVSCKRGSCRVLTCQRGFTVSRDGKTCEAESIVSEKKRLNKEKLAKRQVRTEVLRKKAIGVRGSK